MMKRYHIFFNNYGHKDISVSLNGRLCVPKDIWKDFLDALDKDKNITETLMYQRIAPESEGLSGSKPHSFKFTFWASEPTEYKLARPQTDIYTEREPTKEESLFREWFVELVNGKFLNTPTTRKSRSKSFII